MKTQQHVLRTGGDMLGSFAKTPPLATKARRRHHVHTSLANGPHPCFGAKANHDFVFLRGYTSLIAALGKGQNKDKRNGQLEGTHQVGSLL